MIKATHLHCFGCNDEIHLIDSEDGPCDPERLPEVMLSSGMCGEIWGGYGSRFDMSGFYVAICDSCIDKKMRQGELLRIRLKNKDAE